MQLYTASLTEYKRLKTREVNIGGSCWVTIIP
jgi:hypothetical protein